MKNNKDNGAVSTLPSKQLYRNWNEIAGSNPVSVKTYKCKYCSEEFQNIGVYRNHLRWQHIKPQTNYNNSNGKSEKWIAAMAARKGKKQNIPVILEKCPFCGQEKEWRKDIFTRHKKYCKANPNRAEYKGHACSDSARKKIAEKQRCNSYRRIMRHTQEYNGILYDSSWEVEFAKRLDFLGISFERPNTPIQYIGADGLQHNYFPDFWVPQLQKFVEIKNSYLFEKDPKVKILRQRNDIIWLTSLQQIQEYTLGI